MASISAPTFPSPSARSDPTPHKFAVSSHKFSPSSQSKRSSTFAFRSHSLCSSTSHNSFSSTKVFDAAATLCRCHGCGAEDGSSESDSTSPSDDSSWRWDSAIRDVFRNAIKRLDDYVSARRSWSDAASAGLVEDVNELVDTGNCDEKWDWNRWRKHFDEIDEQERIASILKSQLAHAVKKEDYQEAARLKVAIAAATTNDAVGGVMSQFNKAIEEERYHDAASIRDCGGAGLVGWWAGISDDKNDPYGRIIRISAEHGRFVARSYSPRQLATTTAGAPLFEIFLTINKKGHYEHKAVYLKRMAAAEDLRTSKSVDYASGLKTRDQAHNKDDLFGKSGDDTEDEENRDDDLDTADESEPFGFENILRDMIPGVKVKVLKVTTPGKADRDLISKVIDQMMEEDDEEKDSELEGVDIEDETTAESDEEKNEIDMDTGNEITDAGEQRQLAVKVVIGGLTQKISSASPHRELVRVPASLDKKCRSSFSFCIEKVTTRVSDFDGESPPNKKAKLQSQRSLDHVMFDLARFIGRGKIPLKALKDVSELINLTLKQAQNRQPLSGSTTFSRIEISASSDPLNGLYIGAHGLYTSEVIHLSRKFGQWQDEGDARELQNLEFYEYVEAVKLAGDPYVPAGQVAFRAKVGKRYLLPHKGIIPEEFGVVARYKGQGKLAEPGYQNPRWVDGELVILDGKFIKGGPVVGFVYWAPEYHFLVFFSRLRLE